MTLDSDAAVELERLLNFCAAPQTDTLLRIESEGGQWWEFDAKQFRMAVLSLGNVEDVPKAPNDE